jgi:hypothetical protein
MPAVRFSMRSERWRRATAISLAQVRDIADGGPSSARSTSCRGPICSTAWTPDGQRIGGDRDGATVTVTAVDETAKIDLKRRERRC